MRSSSLMLMTNSRRHVQNRFRSLALLATTALLAVPRVARAEYPLTLLVGGQLGVSGSVQYEAAGTSTQADFWRVPGALVGADYVLSNSFAVGGRLGMQWYAPANVALGTFTDVSVVPRARLALRGGWIYVAALAGPSFYSPSGNSVGFHAGAAIGLQTPDLTLRTRVTGFVELGYLIHRVSAAAKGSDADLAFGQLALNFGVGATPL